MQHRLHAPRLIAIIVVSAFAGCGTAQDDDIDLTFDPCARIELAPANATAEELASIQDAAEMWNALGADLTTAGVVEAETVDAVIPIEFERAAPMFRGIYRDERGDVVINRSLDGRRARAIVVAHELGHAFGLPHVEDRDSVMHEGNLRVTPGHEDVEALRELWPECALSTERNE